MTEDKVGEIDPAGTGETTDEPIRIVPYDPTWPERFERECQALEDAIGEWVDGGVHHVGYPSVMPTLVLDPHPVEIDALLERRHRLGLDHRDEMWEGVLHMNPAPHGRHHRIGQQLAVALDGPARAAGLLPAMGEFNLGSEQDYRVPDGAIHRSGPDQLYYETAAVVVESVSPGDESWGKLPFYAAHDVDELLIVDPEQRNIDWLGLTDGEYRPIERSGLIDFGPNELAERIDWQ